MFELQEKILLFEADEPHSCRNERRLTLIAGSSECLCKNIVIFSGKFCDLPI